MAHGATLRHPFACSESVTEIRDDDGYEWYPDGGDPHGTIARGTRQLARALDARVLATLFTHAYYIQPMSAAVWTSIMQGVAGSISGYGPEYVTMDAACRYARAIDASAVTGGTYEPSTRTLRTTLAGTTDVATKVYVYTLSGSQIVETSMNVPAFSGSIEVTTSAP